MRRVRLTTALGAMLAGAMLLAGCQLEPQPETKVRPTTWSLAAAPDGAELSLIVVIGSSSCDRFEMINVAEGDDSVDISAFVRSLAGDVACTSDLGTQQMSVALDQPLGDRELTGCDPGGAVDCREVRPFP